MANDFPELPKQVWIVIISAVVLLILLTSVIVSYNGMVEEEQEVDASWSEIKNQDQRKIDLIPQLVELLSNYQEFESSTLENITALRSGYLNATSDKERANISMGLSSMYNEIAFTFEAYPDLQSIEALLGVQDEIAGTENRIAYSRSRYIEAVKDYNTKIKKFPGVMTAGMFGFEEKDNLFV
jgi:LemA protein